MGNINYVDNSKRLFNVLLPLEKQLHINWTLILQIIVISLDESSFQVSTLAHRAFLVSIKVGVNLYALSVPTTDTNVNLQSLKKEKMKPASLHYVDWIIFSAMLILSTGIGKFFTQ